MTLSTKVAKRSAQRQSLTSQWFEKGMAFLSVVSLLLVCFDLSYIPLRDFWLQGRVKFLSFKFGQWEYSFPEDPLPLFGPEFSAGGSSWITSAYDPFKGIEPHRDTAAYLATYNQLEAAILEYNLNSPEVETILAQLREQSTEIIETNPFQVADKTGTLERVKNLMRDHLESESARDSFSTFWTVDHLRENGVREELQFFEKNIYPLIETNYFRPIGEDGRLVDNFGLVDFPFGMIFLTEFIARSWFISRRREGISWLDAMLWRWYDAFLFVPLPYWLRFARLLRIIPVTIRLDESNLVDMEKVKRQASQGFVAGIAEDLTEVVVVSLLNQVQGSIRRGEITDLLVQKNQTPYIDLNDTNEIAELTRLVTQVLVNRVIPAARPNIEAILEYSIDKSIADVPAYQGLQNLPGVSALKTNLTHQLVHGLYEVAYDQLHGLVESDPVFDELVEKLSETIVASMQNELQTQQSIERMEYLLNALIDEVKVNYVQRLSEEDVEALMDQTRALRQAAQATNQGYS